MSSESLIVIARLSPKNQEAQNEVLTSLRKATEGALKNEPGTLKFVVATSRDETDSTITIVEQYADQAALEHHRKQPYVEELKEWITTGVLAGVPEIISLDQLGGFDLSRTALKTHLDPVLVFTDLEYKPGKIEEVVPYWKAVFETTRDDEQGALLWQLAKDRGNPNKLFVVHAYESQEYLMTVHATSNALKEYQAYAKDKIVGIKASFLKVHGGFLQR